VPESDRNLLVELGMAICVGVPIVVDGRIWGLLDVFAAEGGVTLGARSVPVLEAIAGQVGAAINRAELFAHVSALAYTDGLTGLGNRRALDERIESAQARGAAVAIAFCDLDGLKEVNDAGGHDAGDAALRCAADARRGGVRAGRLVRLPHRRGRVLPARRRRRYTSGRHRRRGGVRDACGARPLVLVWRGVTRPGAAPRGRLPRRGARDRTPEEIRALAAALLTTFERAPADERLERLATALHRLA
jgi:Diguanylate cyclase, GGDEF domain/GAF domain